MYNIKSLEIYFINNSNKKIKYISNKIEELKIKNYKNKLECLTNKIKIFECENCKYNKNIPNTILFL